MRFRRSIGAYVAVTAALGLLPSPAAATEGPAPTKFVRGVYGRDSSATGLDLIHDTGFNAVTVQPWRDHLDQLSAKSMTGLVWLYGYSNETCSFVRDDAWIRAVVGAIAGHPAIEAYQVDDEPNAVRCPDAPAQLRARSELVRSLDPSKPTLIVVSAWDGREKFPYENFAASADIMGIDIYPCIRTRAACNFGEIDLAIEEAVADGVERFWAILQDFEDDWYRTPTAWELSVQFDRWAGSGMEGYFVYHWQYGGVESKPGHLSVYEEQNARPFPIPTVDTTPPSAPRDLSANLGSRRVALKWGAGDDDQGVVAYVVRRDGRRIGRTKTLRWLNRRSRTAQIYEIVALDAAGNRSEPAKISVVGRSKYRKPTRSSRGAGRGIRF